MGLTHSVDEEHLYHLKEKYEQNILNNIFNNYIQQMIDESIVENSNDVEQSSNSNIEISTNSYSTTKNSIECIVCYDQDINILLTPCNHICLYESCSLRITECPKCRSIITKRTKVNIG